MVFWVASPKLARLFAIWNPYLKSDLEDTAINKKQKSSRTRIFIFTQRIVDRWTLSQGE